MLRKKQVLAIAGAFVIATSSVFAQKTATFEKYTGIQKFKMPENVKLSEFMAKTIIVKVKADLKSSICSGATINHSSFNQLFTALGGYKMGKKFPHTLAPERKYNEQGVELVDLTLVYEFKYTADISLEKAINKFLALGIFEYVEPHFIPHIFTNDQYYSQQWHLPKIKADQAWTAGNMGSSTVVIGITDTGIEYNHPDLQGNLKTSSTDPVGGGDQDGDGYVDNWRGWDCGEDDNDATWQGNSHGVHVTGIAAATTNNTTGVAGVGYNCKYLPVKIADAAGDLVASYEGITYAADHGCQIINCSWGGSYGGQAGQDVITYASINKNCLVVCAAGNDGTETDGFPASFKYAFSIANTNSSDQLNSGSQWGRQIDACAPGTGIVATTPGSYGAQTGTSMASPCAAGAAGNPTYTGLQVGERLRATCDNINSINTSKVGKIGGGRINVYNAVTAALKPAVIMTTRTETDNNDDAFVPGDTIDIRGIYTNYLAPTTNLTCTLSTSFGLYVTVLDGNTTLGAIPTLGTANNNSDPFKIIVKSNAPTNFELECKLTFNDPSTSYTKEEWFKITINVDYINIAVNDVSSSITSNGKVGYRKDGQVGGLGFTYMNSQTILYEAGLMIAKDTNVADAFRGLAATGDADFTTVTKSKKTDPGVISAFDVNGKLKVDPAKVSSLPIDIRHAAYAWTSNGNKKYIMLIYVLKNTGTSTMNGLYAGIATDWDIDGVTFKDNRADYDVANKMGYCYHSATNGIYAGVKVLSNTPCITYSIDNSQGGGGGLDMYDGFSGADKYLAMTTTRAQAGTAGAGVDVAQVVSTGPFNVAAGASVKVAFAMLAGDNLADLQNSATNAQNMYNGLGSNGVNDVITSVNAVKVYPNPANQNSIIEMDLTESATIDLALYNMLGEKISSITSTKLQAGTHKYSYDTSNLASGVYYYQLTIDNKVQTFKLIVSK